MAVLIHASLPPGFTEAERPLVTNSMRKWLLAHAPRNRKELWLALGKLYGFWIAKRAVCPDHRPPMDFLELAFFQIATNILAMAAKGTGKTQDLALLMHASARFKPGVSIAHMGATAEQAKAAYIYMKAEMAKPEFAAEVEASLMSETGFKNRSRVQIMPGTVARASGPHPHIAQVDEFDQLDRETWGHFSKTPVGSPAIRPQIILASTRFLKRGLVNTTIAEMGRRLMVIPWCVYDAMERCTRKCSDTEWLENGIVKRGQCPLYERTTPDGEKVPLCAGKAHKAEGHLTYETVLNSYFTSTQVQWETIQEIKEPGIEGTFFKQLGFEDRYKSPDHKYMPGRDVYLGNDAGFGTSAMGAWQVAPNGLTYQFDEIYLHDATVDDQIEVLKIKPWLKDCKIGWSDPADPAWILALRRFFYSKVGRPVFTEADHDRIPGWRAIHQRLWGPNGEISMGWNSETCPETWRDMQGLVAKESNPEDCEKKDDHGADQTRYLIYNLGKHLNLELAYRTDQRPETGEIETAQAEIEKKYQPYIDGFIQTLTAEPYNFTAEFLQQLREDLSPRMYVLRLRAMVEERTMEGRLRRAGLRPDDDLDFLTDMDDDERD